MFNDMSLRARLMLMTLATIFLPLITAGIYFYDHEEESIYNFQTEYLLASSKHVCQDIDTWISNRKAAIRIVAEGELGEFARELANQRTKTEPNQYKIAELERKFLEKASIMSKSMPQIAEIYLSTLGTPILYNNELKPYSTFNQNPSDPLNRIVYPGGLIYMSTDKKHIGMPWLPSELINSDPDIIAQLNKGEVVLSQRSIINTETPNNNIDIDSTASNHHTSSYSYMSVFVYKEPIDNYADNTDNSILEGRTPVAILSIRIKPVAINSLAPHDNFYVVDNRGQIIAMPRNIDKKSLNFLIANKLTYITDPKSQTRTFFLRTREGTPTEPLAEYSNYYGEKTNFINKTQLDSSSSNGINTTYINILDQKVIGAWSACHQINWFVVMEKTEDELLSSLYYSARLSIIITLSIGAAFMILAFFTANSLIKPIVELSKAADKIAGGDHTTRCRINRRDEIGQLASAFDSMAARIEKAMTALKKARDTAMEANRIKSNFLANMSHELRTPLNAIIGYSEMLIEDAEARDDKDAVQDLRNIHIAGLNLLSNINDILNISKLESGKVNLFVEQFPLSELIMELKASTNSLYQVNNNKFELNCPSSDITLNTDHAKLRQILINLLGNAVKFTKNGVIKLSIEVWSGQKAQQKFYPVPYLNSQGYTVVEADFKPENQVVIFSVQDTGIGLTQEKFSKIFEEFTQADDSISRSYGGTGLGLALVRHYSHILKARLELISQERVGSAFTIKLPLVWEESVGQETANELTLAKSASKSATNNKLS